MAEADEIITKHFPHMAPSATIKFSKEAVMYPTAEWVRTDYPLETLSRWLLSHGIENIIFVAADVRNPAILREYRDGLVVTNHAKFYGGNNMLSDPLKATVEARRQR